MVPILSIWTARSSIVLWGDITVIGMTKRELEEKIKTTISAYVVSPRSQRKIVEFKSKVFYVLGEVGSPREI